GSRSSRLLIGELDAGAEVLLPVVGDGDGHDGVVDLALHCDGSGGQEWGPESESCRDDRPGAITMPCCFLQCPCGLEEPVDHDARETGSDGRSVIPVHGVPITGGGGVTHEGGPGGGALILTRGARVVGWGLVDLPGRLERGGVTGEEKE